MKILYLTDRKFENDIVEEMLRQVGDVELFQYSGLTLKVNPEDYETVIARGFQAYVQMRSSIRSYQNIVVVPDLCDLADPGLPHVIESNKNLKILCLSSSIYSKFSESHCNCFYIQYYPKPIGQSIEKHNSEIEVIFESEESMSISTMTYLCKNIRSIASFNKQDMQPSGLEHPHIYIASTKQSLFELDFIRQMNLGCCVIAPNIEPYNQYISNGTSGYLYNPHDVHPLQVDESVDLDRIGYRAHESTIKGYQRWASNYTNLVKFIKNEEYEGRINLMWETASREDKSGNKPKVSVVTVCRNAELELEDTILSVINQNYSNLEYVVIDGASTDDTVNIIRKYESHINYWHSKPDSGVYPTMIDSLDHVTGDWVIFMNAGDSFASSDALSRLFDHVPPETSIVYGHHIYSREDGIDEVHYAADFDITWRRLQNGYLNYDWFAGMPCHQTVAAKVEVLRKYKFDSNLNIAADHDFYFRVKEAGHRFYNSNEVVSIYVGGGLSAQRLSTCLQEWETIAKKYGNIEAANIFYTKFRNELFPSNQAHNRSFVAIIKSWSKKSPLLSKLISRYKDYIKRKRVSEYEYWANLEDGIMLFRSGRPSFVKTMSGFDSAEGWGRWTTKRKTKIELKSALPRKFELAIKGYAFGPNEGEAAVVKVGRKKYTFTMNGSSSITYTLVVDNLGDSNVIEIRSRFVVSPYKFFNNQSNDKRTLGLAIEQIGIHPL